MSCKRTWLPAYLFITLVVGACSLSFAVTPESCIDGVWFVGVHAETEEARQIGTLQISGDTYNYQPISQAEVPLWMSERFPFINAQIGSVDYEMENLSDERFEKIEDKSTIALLSFSGSDEVFLIRVDQDSEQLYFHAQIGEFQMYEIRRGYAEICAE